MRRNPFRVAAAAARKLSLTGALLVFGLVVVAGAVLGSTGTLGSVGNKTGTNPEAGLSDSQRQAMHDAAHARNSQYLKQFVAQGRDPHSLPVILVESYAAPQPNVGAAVAAADVIVRGKVRTVSFADNPSGGLPLATAIVDVAGTIKGPSSAQVIVQQLGGPVAQGSDGALAELDNDRLLLPGDDAILMLQRASSTTYRPLLGAGVNMIIAGRVEAEAANPWGDAFNGHSVDEVVALL